MPWYQFTFSDLPTVTALDMVEQFIDTMANANQEGLLDRRSGLFKGHRSTNGQAMFYLHADPRTFHEFIDRYNATQCEAPVDAEHISGSNLVE